MQGSVTTREDELLETARSGDSDAFRELVEAHRSELHAHCYRMLGSVHDADDALQDTMLRAWRGLPGFERRSSLRAWLYRIATNVCLKLIGRRPQRVLPLDYGPPADPHDGPGAPLAETLWIEPYRDAPDARYEQLESVELAFIAALQHLPPRQRAALILRDVFGFTAAEVGEALHAAPDAIHSLLQRAHKAVDQRLPELTQQATLRALGDERVRGIVESYVEAFENGDVDRILAMLTDDAVISMPPRPSWFRGRDAVGAFLAGWPLDGRRRWRLLPTRVNGQLAVSSYRRKPGDDSLTAHAVKVLTLAADGRIREITAFLSTDDRWIEATSGISVRNGGHTAAVRKETDGAPHTPSRPIDPLGPRPHGPRLADDGARHARRRDRAEHDSR